MSGTTCSSVQTTAHAFAKSNAYASYWAVLAYGSGAVSSLATAMASVQRILRMEIYPQSQAHMQAESLVTRLVHVTVRATALASGSWSSSAIQRGFVRCVAKALYVFRGQVIRESSTIADSTAGLLNAHVIRIRHDSLDILGEATGLSNSSMIHGARVDASADALVDASWERIQQAVISTQSAGNLLGIGQKVLRGAVYVAIEAWGFSDFLRIRQVQGLSKAGSQTEGCGQPIRLDAVHIGALGSAVGSPKLLRLALGDVCGLSLVRGIAIEPPLISNKKPLVVLIHPNRYTAIVEASRYEPVIEQKKYRAAIY